MRRRQCQCGAPPGPRNPPSKTRLSTSSPVACQKLIGGLPNNAGMSQFQRLITRKLNTPIATEAIKMNFNPLLIHFLIASTLMLPTKLLIDGLEAPAQLKD